MEMALTTLASTSWGAPIAAGASSVLNSGIGSLVSGAFTAASAFGQIAAGGQANAVAKAQAEQYEIAARQEELKGREQADNIRRSLQASLASQRAIFAARGINPNLGTPRALANESSNAASQDIEIARFGSNLQAGALRSQAMQSRIEGKAARTAGYMGAVKTYGRSLVA